MAVRVVDLNEEVAKPREVSTSVAKEEQPIEEAPQEAIINTANEIVEENKKRRATYNRNNNNNRRTQTQTQTQTKTKTK